MKLGSRRRATSAGASAGALLLGVAVLLGVALGSAREAVARVSGDPQKAKELFHQGEVFFDSGQFGKAIEAWQHAYEEKQDPGFLYNIGQAWRLAGDPRKALFFYRSFLRNAPRTARERADAEQKAAALQAQIAAEDSPNVRPAPPATAAPAGTATAPAVQPAVPVETSSPVAATPGQETAPPPMGSPEAPGEPARATDLQPARITPDVPEGGAARDELREPSDAVDFGLAPGVNTWTSGLASGRRSTFAATAFLGYTFGNLNTEARARFRLGGLFQYSAMHEPNGTDTFVDLLIAPTLRIRAWQQRLFVSADLGIGVLALAGLKPSSDFLAHDEPGTLSGAQTLLELRPAATVTFRLYPAVELFGGPALAWSPKKPHFHQPLVRFELLAGAALRF